MIKIWVFKVVRLTSQSNVSACQDYSTTTLPDMNNKFQILLSMHMETKGHSQPLSPHGFGLFREMDD